MFAPLPGTPGSQIPFENCIRVYAHQQDTGGFFISILEKKSEFKAKPESEPKNGVSEATATSSTAPPTPKSEVASTGLKRGADEIEGDIEQPKSPKKTKVEVEDPVEDAQEKDTSQMTLAPVIDSTPEIRSQAPPQQRNRAGQQFEEPFKYISGDHPEVQSVESFYKLSPRFPRDRFMVRNAQGEPAKTIYYTSALIRDILTENEGKGIKFIHGGVKMFMKQDVQGDGVCKWRIQSEGMPILEGYVGEERVVRLYKRETLRKLLIEMFPKLAEGAWKNLDEIGERVSNIGMGCCVLRIEPSADADGFQERIVLPLWRSLHSLNLMLAKEDRTAMLLRIYNDTTPLVNNHNVGKNKQDAQKEDAVKPEDTLAPEGSKEIEGDTAKTEDGAVETQEATNPEEVKAGDEVIESEGI